MIRPQAADPTVSERLRDLASDVRRIGYGWRSDPEEIAMAKDTVAKELLSIAREVER